ncbi:MAG: SBBP repeat-containing protein [Chloroflexia bacterium]
MKRTWILGMAAALALALLLALYARPGTPPAAPPPPPSAPAAARIQAPALAGLPLAFEANAGQIDPSVRFQAHTPGGRLFFTPAEVVLALNRGVAAARSGINGEPRQAAAPGPSASNVAAQPAPQMVRLSFLGSNPATELNARDLLPGKVNYFIGNNPRKWTTNVPTYGTINYTGLYPGVDLSYAGSGDSLKGTYTVAPGADPHRIRWRYTNAECSTCVLGVSVATDGNLHISIQQSSQQQGPSTEDFQLVEAAPVAWQELGGRRVVVAARYEIEADGSIGFALGGYDRAQPLTLDPVLSYSSFLGGSNWDDAGGVALDAAGNIYLAGYTNSSDFPTFNALQPTYHGGPYFGDAFVTKLAPDGRSLIYSTYFGGTGDEAASALAVDAAGEVYLTGITRSTDFPTHNAFQPTSGGGLEDAFVTKLNASGSALIYSTYLGGEASDYGNSIVIDGAGQAYVAGGTFSQGFPTQNAFQRFLAGAANAFVSKLAADGQSLIYSTYIGGGGVDEARAIALDAVGNVYISGNTTSSDFPTHNAFQPTCGSCPAVEDAFVTKLAADGQSLVYSTFLGGSSDESGWGIALDGAGAAYVTGGTNSLNFPTHNAFQPTCHCDPNPNTGFGDAFVTKLAPDGGSLAYSTFLGGSADDLGYAIAVNGLGEAYVAGDTISSDFPTLNPVQRSCRSCPTYTDAFVTRLNAAGSALVYSTFLGGQSPDRARAITLDATGEAYVAGYARSPNFPTHNAYQSSYGGGNRDAFLAKLADTPVPVTPTPAASPTPCAAGVFSDVHPSDYFYTPVSYLASHGVISGYSDCTFRPYNNTTRSQMVKIVVLGFNKAIVTPAGGAYSFTDVPTTNPFFSMVETAYADGIVSGYTCGAAPAGPCDSMNRPYFLPYTNVTRGQLSKIDVIAAGWTLYDPATPTFTDVAHGSTFYQVIETAVCHGVISGYADHTFRPFNNAIRGQIAKIVYLSIVNPPTSCGP